VSRATGITFPDGGEGVGLRTLLEQAQRWAMVIDRRVVVTFQGVSVDVHATADLRVVEKLHERLWVAEQKRSARAQNGAVARG